MIMDSWTRVGLTGEVERCTGSECAELGQVWWRAALVVRNSDVVLTGDAAPHCLSSSAKTRQLCLFSSLPSVVKMTLLLWSLIHCHQSEISLKVESVRIRLEVHLSSCNSVL